MRNLVWTPLGKLRLPYDLISVALIVMGDFAYFAFVPYNRNFTNEDEHLSMLFWNAYDDAAACSLADDDRLTPNGDIAPSAWATIDGTYRYAEVCVLPNCTATYSGTSGRFRWKTIADPTHRYLCADEEIDGVQLPSVIQICENTT